MNASSALGATSALRAGTYSGVGFGSYTPPTSLGTGVGGTTTAPGTTGTSAAAGKNAAGRPGMSGIMGGGAASGASKDEKKTRKRKYEPFRIDDEDELPPGYVNPMSQTYGHTRRPSCTRGRLRGRPQRRHRRPTRRTRPRRRHHHSRRPTLLRLLPPRPSPSQRLHRPRRHHRPPRRRSRHHRPRTHRRNHHRQNPLHHHVIPAFQEPRNSACFNPCVANVRGSARCHTGGLQAFCTVRGRHVLGRLQR